MDEKYIIMIIIFAISYVVTSIISKNFKNASGGNSIKLEEKITFENILFLIEGIFYFFSFYLVSIFKVELAKPIFYIDIILVLILFIAFIRNLIKELNEFFSNSRTGSMWNIIFIQFIKFIIITYLVYNYYLIYIN